MEQHPMDPDFDALVLAEIDAIHRIGRSRLQNRQEVDDFTQDVILRLYANRTRLRDAARFPQWAAAIARNTSSKWNRKRVPIPVALPPDVPAGGPSSQQRLEDDERARATLAALHRLEQDDRDILVAHYMDDATYAALEREYGLTRSAVAMRLQRARERLRRKLRRGVLGVIGVLLAPRRSRAFGATPERGRILTRAIFGSVSAACIVGGALAPVGAPPGQAAHEMSIHLMPLEPSGDSVPYGAPRAEEPGDRTAQDAPHASGVQPGAASSGDATTLAPVDISHTGMIMRAASWGQRMRKPYLRVDVTIRYVPDTGVSSNQIARLADKEGAALIRQSLMQSLARDSRPLEEIRRDQTAYMARMKDAIREQLVQGGFPAPTNVAFPTFVLPG